jgi:hypothetical protein
VFVLRWFVSRIMLTPRSDMVKSMADSFCILGQYQAIFSTGALARLMTAAVAAELSLSLTDWFCGMLPVALGLTRNAQ